MVSNTYSHNCVKRLDLFQSLLAIILLLAAAIRIWHIFAIYPLPLFNNLIIDSKMYDDWAMLIIKGNWLGGDKAFYMDPLYSYLLAIQYSIFGHNLLIPRIVQVILGVGICMLIGLIGRRIGGNSVGLIAALLAALYQPLVFEGGEIEKTTIGVFLITAALYCAACKPTASRFATGALLALATLCRGNLLLLGPLAVIFFLFNPESTACINADKSENWFSRAVSKKSVLDAVAFILGFFITLSPVFLRNHYVSGEWVLTTSQMGANVYLGNNPENVTGGYYTLSFVRSLPNYEQYDFHTKAEELTGRKLTGKEVSSFWLHEAFKHITNNPSFATQVLFRKIILFWGDFEVPDGWSLYFISKYSPALRLSLVTFGWITSFALIGAITSFRSGREQMLLKGFAIAYFFSVIVFFILSRYRIYVVPPLIVFAALGIDWLWNRLRERNWHKFFLATFATVVTAVFSFYGTTTFGYTPDNFVYDYAHLAELYEEQEDYKSAEALLQEAIKLKPDSDVILSALGSLQLNTGNPKGAVSYLRRCIEISPNYQNAWNTLGIAYEQLNEYQAARKCFEIQLRIVPGHQRAKENLQRLILSGKT